MTEISGAAGPSIEAGILYLPRQMRCGRASAPTEPLSVEYQVVAAVGISPSCSAIPIRS